MPEHYELRLLADYVHPAALLPQAVNTWRRPTPLAVGGELENDERGEVVYAEIYSPTAAGWAADEELRKVVVVADGQETGKYVSLSGVRSNNMAPPKNRIWNGRLFSFGTPRSNNPLLSTTIKYKQNVTVACLAGPLLPITIGYRVRLWGYVYKANELPAVFGTMNFPAYLVDHARGRTLAINKSPIPVNAETWLTLPGGKDQAIPKINPFARYAYNAQVTDGLQGDYQFRFQTGGVIEEQEDMYFEFDDKDALLIEGLGIAAANDAGGALGNLARTGLRISGAYHPKGPTTQLSLYPTNGDPAVNPSLRINQLNYGLFLLDTAVIPSSPPMYEVIPKLERPLLIWNEIGFVVVRDDGALAIPVDTIVAALTGIRIEMRG
jgi:hypothetical protein